MIPVLLPLLLLQAAPLTEVSPAKSCGVSVTRAASGLGQCDAVKRAKHGWLGLLQSAKGWSLSPLLSRKSDGGEAFNGLCVEEPTWASVALRGATLKAGPLWVAELTGDADCRLPSTEVTLGGTRWTVSRREGGKLELADSTRSIELRLGSDCWTSAAITDLDRDGVPDLIAVREGGGFTFVVLLSSTRSPDGVVRVCAAASGPPC